MFSILIEIIEKKSIQYCDDLPLNYMLQTNASECLYFKLVTLRCKLKKLTNRCFHTCNKVEIVTSRVSNQISTIWVIDYDVFILWLKQTAFHWIRWKFISLTYNNSLLLIYNYVSFDEATDAVEGIAIMVLKNLCEKVMITRDARHLFILNK